MIRQLIAAFATAFALMHAHAAVDVNQASRADLETVKGIGPGLSAKIVEARKSGNFRSWADLADRVGGIGTGNAAKFSSAGLTVGGVAYDAAAAPAAPAKGSQRSPAKAGTGAAKDATPRLPKKTPASAAS